MDRDELSKFAHDRLFPSLRDPNYLVLRSRRLTFAPYLRTLPDNLTVLDVGGRYQPYRPLLEGKISKYVGLDVQQTEFVDVVATGEHIPFRNETFNLVIATAVFEYFRDPQQAASEVYRVLKPGGSLLVSVAAVAPRFVNEERWRYLPLGLKTVFGSFSRLNITPEVLSLGGFCRLINLGMHDFLKLKLLKSIYEVTACPIVNTLGVLLEKARLTSNDYWAGNYDVIAVK